MLVTVAENVVMVASNGAPVVTSSDPIRLGGEDRASAHLVVESMWGTCGNVPRLTIRTYVSNDGVSFVEVLPGQVFDTTTVGLKADVRAVHGAFVRYVFTLDPAGTPTLGPAAASFDLHVLFDHS